MWLYVPTSCQSAPGLEDLTSASDSLAQMLARSVTWNGKLSRSQTWLQRFKRVSWTTLLFGAILPRSTVDRGVERWIGLLAESHVSHTAPQDSGLGLATSGTSGRTPPGSLEQSDPASSFWRTFQESWGITTSASGQSYEEWATGLRKDYSRRMNSAHRTSGNGSLSWATPNPSSSASQTGEWTGSYYRRGDGAKVQTVLTHQATNWGTPRATDYKDARAYPNNGGVPLPHMAQNWPTPNAGPQNDEDSKWEERRAVAKEKHGNGNGFGLTLGMVSTLWPTATVSTSAYAYGRGNPETPNLKLDGAARTFPTPNANAQKGFTSTDGKGRASDCKSYSHLPQTTMRPGHDCSPKCRRLNPLFVEKLMGWPGGWTLLATGRTGSESLATEWFHWWRLMRSALSRLGRD